MNIGRGRSACVWVRAIIAGLICSSLAVACAPIRGYPDDPENTDATLSRLVPYFNGDEEKRYFATAATARTPIRDEIVYARIRAYDIEFADFERKLYGDANSVSLGSDLVGLVLAGLTATTGNAATKSALGAASAGVLGANTAITRDLFYQKTVPALLAQMEADRLTAKAPIVAGLRLSDAEYSLMQAYADLEAYKNAGSIPSAINAINRDAGNAKNVALEELRNAPFVEDTFSKRIRAYIWPAGIDKPENKDNLAKLRAWMDANPNLPKGLPVERFIDAKPLAGERMKAVAALSIP